MGWETTREVKTTVVHLWYTLYVSTLSPIGSEVMNLLAWGQGINLPYNTYYSFPNQHINVSETYEIVRDCYDTKVYGKVTLQRTYSCTQTSFLSRKKTFIA